MIAHYPSLRNRHFLVSGGCSGIGAAVVTSLLEQDCRVSVADLNPRPSDSAQDRLTVTRVDVSSREQVDAWVKESSRAFGLLSGVVISAGIEPEDDTSVDQMDDDVWTRALSVNLTGAMNVARAAAKELLRASPPNGSIVFIGSPTGYFGSEIGHHAYSASKGGVNALSRVMAVEYAPTGLRVNVVWPGLIETPINHFILRDPAKLRKEIEAIPAGRMGKPADIAPMVCFLLSDQSQYCVGGIFAVDGGLTAV